MSINSLFINSAASAIQQTILAHESELESLDRAIGDGDHYINMKRGAQTIVDMQQELATLTPDAALNKIGMKLLSTIGGASGPLLASFFMGMAKTIKENAEEEKWVWMMNYCKVHELDPRESGAWQMAEWRWNELHSSNR